MEHLLNEYQIKMKREYGRENQKQTLIFFMRYERVLCKDCFQSQINEVDIQLFHYCNSFGKHGDT